ncbi:MAG TPA: molybdopterin-dependent oxidoreductase [Nocardioidaceae bacterium]|nr:molybdopterin-dependent oxidoreductase [Nocardioidaceae bacterium]
MSVLSGPRRALAGLVTAGAGIAVSVAVTNLLHARANPIQAVAETIIEITPGSIAESLIHVVGKNDKPLLITGVTVVILLLGAVAGLLSGRRRWPGSLLFVAMAAVALAAEASRPEFGAATLIPLAAGLATWLLVLLWLVPDGLAAPEPAIGRADSRSTSTRRGFLLRAGGVAVAAAVVSVLGDMAGRGRRTVESTRRALHLPVNAGTVPGDVSAGIDVGDMAPWRTPNDRFYRIDTALVLPAVDPDTWKLRIHGMVDKDIVIDYQDLVSRKMTETWVTICCVSNPVGGGLIGNAYWSGVRIADLLAEAGVHPGATAVKQTSQDGWTCGTPIQALTDDRNAMLAVAMNGEPLPIEHGFPVRMIVPGLFGYVSATKWLVDLEVTRFDKFSAYWTERGWSPRGPIKTESRIEAPRNGAQVKAGTVGVGGHAWAQHTGIAKVEYQLDGHAWQRAELGGVPDLDTWVQWAGRVDVQPGSHLLKVRATDKSGYTQTGAQMGVLPDGATGWHRIGFSAA